MKKTNISNSEGAKILRSFGIKPSSSRTAIYRYLREQKNHPTVDAIYQALLPDNPTMSRTTVYNSLNLFMERGAVQPVLIESGEMRFDADVSIHGHVKCLECDTVFDIFFNSGQQLPPAPDGFQILDAHLYYRGICNDCSKQKKRRQTDASEPTE